MIGLKEWKGAVACWAVLVLAGMSAAQDSVSLTACLPGDGVSPYADASAAHGSEQCNDYVVDLSPFQSSWGNTFGIAPIIKSSKESATFFGSLTSAQGISRLQQAAVPFVSSSYQYWCEAGAGVNNDPALNTPGELLDTSSACGNQFGVTFAEFSNNYNGVISALVNYDPTDPTRLYVRRTQLATNGCDSSANLSQIATGSVDAFGNVVMRADDFGVGGACGLAPISGNNVYRLNMLDRNCDELNIISANYPGLVSQDDEWLVRSSATAHGTPGLMPQGVTGGLAKYLGGNFDIEYVRGSSNSTLVADMSHLPAGVTDQRGNLSYTTHNCGLLNSTHGMAAMIAQEADGSTNNLMVFGLDGDANVTGTLRLDLPSVINDPCDGGGSIPGGVPEFDHYHSQVAFRGGNGQIAMAIDQQGNLLVAAEADHPADGGADWPVNMIAVAKVNCETGNVSWTLAGFNDLTSGTSGTGKPIRAGSGGAIIGRMVTLDLVTGGSPFGPSVSAPMFDSVGNCYFLSAMELFNEDGSSRFTSGLLRAVYDPTNFCYELELLWTLGDVFPGANSKRDYLVVFAAIADSNSVNSGTAWSQNIMETAHTGMDPADLDTSDPRTLGGLIIAADIIYDWDESGTFETCVGTGGEPEFEDQRYNVILYVGSVEPGTAVTCKEETGDGDCDNDGDVDLIDFATFQVCFSGAERPADPGCECADFDGDGDVDLTDFGGFQLAFTGPL